MLRWGLLAVVLGAVAFGAASLAQFPGSIMLVWKDWRIDTALGVFIAALVVFAGIVIVALPAVVVAQQRAAPAQPQPPRTPATPGL